MKPLWFVEKDAFGWTINCRFMLNGEKAGIGNLIATGRYENTADKPALLSGVIRYMTNRRQTFIAEESGGLK